MRRILLVQHDIVFETVRYGAIWCVMARYGTVHYGTVRYGTVWCGAVRCGALRYGTVRYGTVPHGTVRDAMTSYVMV